MYIHLHIQIEQDLICKIPMKEAIQKEKEFFTAHPLYKTMTSGFFGMDVLIQNLTKILFKMILRNLPGIIKSINENLKKAENKLATLSEPIPIDNAGKLSLLRSTLNKYCYIFKNVLLGK